MPHSLKGALDAQAMQALSSRAVMIWKSTTGFGTTHGLRRVRHWVEGDDDGERVC